MTIHDSDETMLHSSYPWRPVSEDRDTLLHSVFTLQQSGSVSCHMHGYAIAVAIDDDTDTQHAVDPDDGDLFNAMRKTMLGSDGHFETVRFGGYPHDYVITLTPISWWS